MAFSALQAQVQAQLNFLATFGGLLWLLALHLGALVERMGGYFFDTSRQVQGLNLLT